jgi:hypothetical protein
MNLFVKHLDFSDLRKTKLLMGWNRYIKLDLPADQESNELGSKEAAIGPKADLFDLGGQLLKNFFQKLLGPIRGVVNPIPQKPTR